MDEVSEFVSVPRLAGRFHPLRAACCASCQEWVEGTPAWSLLDDAEARLSWLRSEVVSISQLPAVLRRRLRCSCGSRGAMQLIFSADQAKMRVVDSFLRLPNPPAARAGGEGW